MHPEAPEPFTPNNRIYENMFNNERDHWWYRGLRSLLFFWLGTLKVKNVLDAGCGTGENMHVLRSKKYNVYGFDVSDKAVSYCRKKGLEDVLRASISKLPYQDSLFDCIYCMDVFACLTQKEYQAALIEFKRCLKSHGYLIINVAALPFLFSNHDVAWKVKRRFLVKDIETDLKVQGFEIVKSTYRVFFLFPLAVVYKLFNKMYYRYSKDVPDHIDKVNVLLNGVFTGIMLAENYLLRLINLPIGTSIFIVARKK
ncbi:MAG: class I SAM-dependent methyltransferase [Patescibacteria group bacterium]